MGSTSVTVIGMLALSALLATSIGRAESIPLTYDETLIAKGFPSPLVVVAVRKQPAAQFLVDNGAPVHALASWFVKAAGIATQAEKGSARGSTGSETTVRVTRHVDLTLENGRHLQLEHAIVIDFPPIFEELRIAGLLSPQSFAPENLAAVLDLRAPSLTIEPFQKAIDRLHIAPMPEGRVCERNFYAIPIFAAGRRGFALLDTGATGTVIAPESQIAKALESRSIEGKHTQGVGGKIIENRHVPAVEIQRAGVPAVVDLNIGKTAGPACAADGLLGMDALRHCVLVMGKSALGMACDSPGNLQ